MKTLVYDVAASESGALGVLEDFYLRAVEDIDNEYVFIVSTPVFAETSNVRVCRFPEVKNGWLSRLRFDYFSAPKLVKDEMPDTVLSLQNMGIPRISVPQTIYEHNCIFKPFTEYRFSLFKETGLWVRQNIIGYLTIRSLRKADNVIVQTDWMKRRCVEKLGIHEECIKVKPPILKNVPEVKYAASKPFTFIYPANAFKYKNHSVILEACGELDESFFSHTRILFTLDSKPANVPLSEKLNKFIECVGWLDRGALYEIYSHSCILFTSMLESYPLPLYEAKVIGCPIIVPDLEYAHEILDDYERVFFFNCDDSSSLAATLLEVKERYEVQ